MKKFFNSLKSLNALSGDDIFHSSKPVAISSFLFVAIIITTLLSIRYCYFKDIVENGIAQKTIIAKNSFEVEDRQKTELIKREASNKIRPIVTPIEGDYIKTDLQKAIDDIEHIKKEKTTYSIKQKKLSDMLEISDITRKNQAINYVLSTSSANLNSTFTNIKYILNELLQIGVFVDSDINNFINDSEIKKILGQHVKKNEYPLIIGLIEHCVIPNLIIDEYATETARKNARNAIKPYIVTFKKGDVIIQKDERVTQFKKDALKLAGFNAFELNGSGVFGIFALVCLTMYSLILYIKQYEKKYYTPRYMSYVALSSIILTSCCHLNRLRFKLHYAFYCIHHDFGNFYKPYFIIFGFNFNVGDSVCDIVFRFASYIYLHLRNFIIELFGFKNIIFKKV